MLLNSLGLAFMFKEKYDKALEFNYESLALREEDGDSLEMSVVLGNIGLMHYKLGDHKLAIKYSNRSLDFSGKNFPSKVNSYTTIGSSYLEMEQYELANYSFRKALNYDKSPQDLGYRAKIFHGFARSMFLSKKPDSAEHYANLSYFFAKKLSDKWTMTLSSLILSMIAIERNNIDESSRFLSIADSVSLSSDYPYLRLEVIRQKARHLAKSGKYGIAFKVLEEHEALRDSLFHGENDQRIRKIQVAFAQRENERKINAQASILALKNDALAKHRIFILVVSGLLVVVVVLAIELFRANRKKQKINQLLDVRVAERTRELGYQRDALQHGVAEQRMIKVKVAGELMSHLNTLQGLVHLGKIDQPGNAGLYFTRVEGVIVQMSDAVNKFLSDGQK